MRKPNLHNFEYGNSSTYKKNKEYQNKIINVLNDKNQLLEASSNIESITAKALVESTAEKTAELLKNDKSEVNRRKRAEVQKLVTENTKKSLKNFLVATTFEALDINPEYLNENKTSIIKKLNEFYTEAFSSDLVSLEKFQHNKYDMIRKLHNIVEGTENRQIHIHIYNDKSFNTTGAPASDAHDEEKEEDDKSEDALKDLDSEESGESTDDSTSDDDLGLGDDFGLDDEDLDMGDDSTEESKDEKSEDKSKEEKPEKKDKSKPKEESEEEAKGKAKKISKNAADTVKEKVSDVLSAEKEASKKIKDVEKSMKESGNAFTLKAEPTLFKSILMSTHTKFLKEAENLYKENNDKFMDMVYNESVIIYTLLETLNTCGFLPEDHNFTHYIARQFQKN